jgi:hypothetical protein
MIYVLITLVYLLGCVALYFGPAFYGYEDLDDKFRFNHDLAQYGIIFFWPVVLPLIVVVHILAFVAFIILAPIVYIGIMILEQMNNFRKSIYEKHKK